MRQMNNLGFIEFRRLEIAILKVAAKLGLDGDIYADAVPKVGTMNQQLMIVQIQDGLPRTISRACPTLAKQLARNIVLSSTGENKQERQSTNRNASSWETSPVARERQQAARRLARGAKQ